MDPISLAILAALGAGAASGLSDAAKDALSTLYQSLKTHLLSRAGEAHPDLPRALDKLETTPTSVPWRGVLVEEVQAAHLDRDPELLPLARQLLDQVAQQPGGSQFLDKVEHSAVSFSGSATVYNIQGDQHITHAPDEHHP